jgi:hypothetical protein
MISQLGRGYPRAREAEGSGAVCSGVTRLRSSRKTARFALLDKRWLGVDVSKLRVLK